MLNYSLFKKEVRYFFCLGHTKMTKAEYLGTMVHKSYHGWKNYYRAYKEGTATTKEWR